MTEAVFDHSAAEYDRTFTNSFTGKMQRLRVWKYLMKSLPKHSPLNILELNCGTGEDAMFLASMGHNVTATDISPEMVKIASAKYIENQPEGKIDFNVMAIEEIEQKLGGRQFDVVFSNFGGLNCLSPDDLSRLFDQLDALLSPYGRFIGVIMPRFCLTETIYFLAVGKWSKAFRRLSKNAVYANVDGKKQATWYYSPGAIRQMTSKPVKLKKVRPIGFFIPPSYLESFVQPKKTLQNSLNSLESVTGNWPMLAGWSDHFLFDVRKKS